MVAGLVRFPDSGYTAAPLLMVHLQVPAYSTYPGRSDVKKLMYL